MSSEKDEIMTFKVKNDEGVEVECEVLFTFESEETGKNYIVYTDNTLDEDGNTKVYASIYNPDEQETKLLPIETDKEWKIIKTILDELQNAANSGKEDFDSLTETIDKRIKSLNNSDDDEVGFDSMLEKDSFCLRYLISNNNLSDSCFIFGLDSCFIFG
ncbi:DUF1292 domain-containing protein [bacterium]|nr:DUF1292 domain-containing protein [bacterium]